MKLANGLKMSAEILLGVTLVILLSAGTIKMVTSDFTGIWLLIPAAVFAIFMWLGWLKPSETGFALVLLGAVVIIFFGNTINSSIAWVMMGCSTLAAGLLLLGAGWKFHQNHNKSAPS